MNLLDELQNIYIKFDQAERQWQNRLTDLGDAHDNAYVEFVKHLPKGSSSSTGEGFDYASNVVLGGLALGGGPAIVAAPIVYGLRKLAGILDSEVEPPTPKVLSLKKRVKEIQKAFRDTTEHLGGEIVRLIAKAEEINGSYNRISDLVRRSSNGTSETEIRKAISTLLLSPVWYPPNPSLMPPVGLARALELRMWFLYWKQLENMGHRTINLDLSPMAKRFKAMEYGPVGIMDDWNEMIPRKGFAGIRTYRKPPYEKLRALARHGEKKMSFAIYHKYPAPVQEYLKKTRSLVRRSWWDTRTKAIGESDLPQSTLTWADVRL
jgi:hypothetical protein